MADDFYKTRHQNIIKGLTIFASVEEWGVCAVHDELLAGPEPDEGKLTKDQKEELEGLGWFPDDEHGSWGFFT